MHKIGVGIVVIIVDLKRLSIFPNFKNHNNNKNNNKSFPLRNQ